MAQDYFSRMSDGDKALAGGSILVLISLFLPWYGWDIGPYHPSLDGFHSWGWLTILAWLALVAFWTIRRFFNDEVQLPAMTVSDAGFAMICGAVEVAGAALFWLTYHTGLVGLISEGVRYGTFIAIVGGALTIVGGYLEEQRSSPTT